MPGKVLVADDSLNVQKTLSQLLSAAGVEVVTVGNGEHAVRKLAEFKPDLVLADVFMPVRSGFEVCEYIKNSAEFAHVPVLLLASSLEPYDEKEAVRVGADGRINKPFSDPEVVLNTVQQWLAKAAAAAAAVPVPAVEEVAATAPVMEEEVVEPAYEESTTRPPAVSFEGREAPLGFAEVLEEAPTPTLPPAEAAPVPAAMMPEPEPEPEVAPAWEMIERPPGAPEIPAGEEWESQWKGIGEAAPAVEMAAVPPGVKVEPPYAEAVAPEKPAEIVAEEAAAEARAPLGVDPAVVEAVVQEVIERLSPQITEQISKEVIRSLTEALLKEKLNQR